MDIAEYSSKAHNTAVYPTEYVLEGQGAKIVYNALGCAGEAGELANQAKKVIRDDGGHITAARRAKMLDEAGDVLWYLNELAMGLGSTLEQIAVNGLAKIQQRNAEMKTLKGDGHGAERVGSVLDDADVSAFMKCRLAPGIAEQLVREAEADRDSIARSICTNDLLTEEQRQAALIALQAKPAPRMRSTEEARIDRVAADRRSTFLDRLHADQAAKEPDAS